MSRPTLDAAIEKCIAEFRKIGWVRDIDGDLVPPVRPHAEHVYDGACAICCAGTERDALLAIIEQVVDIHEDLDHFCEVEPCVYYPDEVSF